MHAAQQPPVVLVIAGNDPSGGAGLAADIQAIGAAGAHPAPVVAALTVQDTRDVQQVQAVDARLVRAQAEAVLADLPVAAIKLGLLASADVGREVAALLQAHTHIPLVIDPVLAASGGGRLAQEGLLAVYREALFPLATLITPNAAESRRFAPEAKDAAARAAILLASGARHVLIKGADEDSPDVLNQLFSQGGARQQYTWPRLPGQYHGSGCTLASAIAARLARGQSMETAIAEAQRYTWESLQRGWRLGHGQHIPDRLP